LGQVKGRYITLTGFVLATYKDSLEAADRELFSKTGKHWDQLDPEGWYDIKLWGTFLDAYAKASPFQEKSVIWMGKMVYPNLKKAGGVPADLKTPLDFIKFEGEGFMKIHRGPDVKPRRIVKAADHEVVVEAHSPGYPSSLTLGMYQGILDLAGVKTGRVVQTKFQEKGAPASEFQITW
jgi:hypothetical protein